MVFLLCSSICTRKINISSLITSVTFKNQNQWLNGYKRSGKKKSDHVQHFEGENNNQSMWNKSGEPNSNESTKVVLLDIEFNFPSSQKQKRKKKSDKQTGQPRCTQQLHLVSLKPRINVTTLWIHACLNYVPILSSSLYKKKKKLWKQNIEMCW